MLRRLWMCCLLVSTSVRSLGQLPDIEQFTIDDGLASNTVYHIIQDHNGYIWFATGIGVSRFDGHEFLNFDLSDGLTDLDVLKLFEDSKGRIWFLFLNGTACYFENGKIWSETDIPQLRELRIESGLASIAEDSKGTIYFGGITGNITSLSAKNEINKYQIGPPLNFFMRTEGEKLYLLSSYGNYVLENKEFIRLPSELRPFGCDDIFYDDSTSTSYFLTRQGIAGFNHGEARIVDPFQPEDAAFESVKSFCIDNKRNYWFNTQTRGVWKYAHTASGFNKELFFESSLVNFVFCDREGSIWVSTSGDGIFQIRGKHPFIENIPLNANTKKAPIITTFAMNKEGALWVGTITGEVYKVAKDAVETQSWKDEIKKNCITEILCEGDEVYVSDIYRARRIHQKTGDEKVMQQITLYLKTRDHITFKKMAAHNGEVYGASYGIFKRNANDEFELYHFPDIKNERINAMHIDEDGTIWYNHANLLNVHKNGKTVSFEHLRHEFRGKITDIGRLKNGTLAITTYGSGIKFLQNNRITATIDENSGLASNICRDLFIDGDTMYVATNKGFSIVRCVNGKYSVQTLSGKDHLPSVDIKCIAAAGNLIYIGTATGLFAVNKHFSQSIAAAPQLLVQRISADKEPLDLNNIKIASDFVSLVIQYAAITFVSPEEVYYAYRFSDKEPWIETRQSSLEFNRLSPGDYHLQLRAKKFDSDWGEPVRVEFSIIPLWWQSIWFKGFLLAFAFIAALWILRRRQQYTHLKEMQEWKKQEAVDEERMRIAEDMHDDIGADLSNLLLVARMGKRDAQEGEGVISNYEQIESITTDSLQKIDEIIWSLKAQNDSLHELISFTEKYFYEFMTNSRLKGTFRLKNEMDDLFLPASTRRNVFLIVKEAIHNIVKHAHATEVTLDVEVDSERMLIVLCDDGVGIALVKKERNGNGLKNMTSRIEKLGGKISIAPFEEKGTRITIILPLTSKSSI